MEKLIFDYASQDSSNSIFELKFENNPNELSNHIRKIELDINNGKVRIYFPANFDMISFKEEYWLKLNICNREGNIVKSFSMKNITSINRINKYDNNEYRVIEFEFNNLLINYF